MTNPNITPDQVARWKALCEENGLPWCYGIREGTALARDDGKGLVVARLDPSPTSSPPLLSVQFMDLLIVLTTALPALILAYEQVVKDFNILSDLCSDGVRNGKDEPHPEAPPLPDEASEREVDDSSLRWRPS